MAKRIMKSIPLKLDDVKQVKVSRSAQGSSGIEIFTGDFSEEYLAELNGNQRADKFDRMRRSDAIIKMCLSAVKNTLRSGEWEWRPGEQDDQAMVDHAEFLEHVFFKDMKRKTWRQTLNEALTCIDFGHSVFEKTHKLVMGHKRWGDYIGLEHLGWRSPKTIEEWHVEKDTGKLKSIRQVSYGDLARDVVIDGDFLSVISLEQEGDLFEGFSMLRPVYGPWKRKDLYLKLMAIGIEKDAISTPKIVVPDGKQDSDQYSNMVEAVEAYTSHQCSYITVPEGWELDLVPNNFDPDKVKASIEFEDKQIMFAFLANFLGLGSGGTGSYALSNDLSDFFLGGINYVADTVCEVFDKIGQELIIMNFGPQEKYPCLKVSGIDDKAGQEFGVLLKNLSDGRYIMPDDTLEGHLRKRLGLPEADIETRRETPAGTPGGNGNPPSDDEGNEPPDPEESEPEPNAEDLEPENDGELDEGPGHIQLAEKRPEKQIDEAQASIKNLMQSELRSYRDKLLKRIETEYRKSSESARVNIPTKIKKSLPSGRSQYKKELKRILSMAANGAIDRAKEETKLDMDIRSSNVFMEMLGFKFEEKKLPPKLRNRVNSQADLLADTTSADLEKIVFFAFGDSLESTDSLATILNDVNEASEKEITGPKVNVAAANVAARVVNEARNAFFFDEQVLKEVESMTFVNPSPKSAICQDLAGRTFDHTDPENLRYRPPLHHNCKSTLKVNLKGSSKRDRDDRGLRPSKPELEKLITLTESKKDI